MKSNHLESIINDLYAVVASRKQSENQEVDDEDFSKTDLSIIRELADYLLLTVKTEQQLQKHRRRLLKLMITAKK